MYNKKNIIQILLIMFSQSVITMTSFVISSAAACRAHELRRLLLLPPFLAHCTRLI